MSVQKQPVLANSRLMAAMRAMYWYCVKETCEKCPYSVKQDGRLACAFSARQMQAAFTTLQAHNELPGDNQKRTNANRRNGRQPKDVAINIRVTESDRQMLAEVSAIQGISVSELFRAFVKDAHASVHQRLSCKTYHHRQGSADAGQEAGESNTQAPGVVQGGAAD